MTTEAEIGVIHPTHLLELYQMGLRKLVPMSKNGDSKYSWTPIYENPHYWTQETLVKRAADFRDGVGICLGDTGISDEQGSLYHNVLDIDSDAVYDILFVLQNPGSKHSLFKKISEEGCLIK